MFLARSAALRYIKSGDWFEMRTDDPEARPLPSWELLEMQWFLQRVVGMAGAAEFRETTPAPEDDLDDEVD